MCAYAFALFVIVLNTSYLPTDNGEVFIELFWVLQVFFVTFVILLAVF